MSKWYDWTLTARKIFKEIIVWGAPQLIMLLSARYPAFWEMQVGVLVSIGWRWIHDYVKHRTR